MSRDPQQEVLVDLMRSGWVIETARAIVYRGWAATDSRFQGPADNAAQAAGIFEADVVRRGRRTDPGAAESHAAWITGLVGEEPNDRALADWFVARLGDWVGAHASDFLAEGAARLKELHEDDKRFLSTPEMPEPPAFEPVESPVAKPPGDVLFRFAILGDLHIGSPTGEPMVRAAIEDINRSGVELTIQLGDIADHGNRNEFERAVEVLSDLAMPWEVIVGNHDMYSTAEERLAGRAYFAEFFGREADGKLFEHRGRRFALLDSAEEIASPFAPYSLVTGQFMEGNGGAIVRGALTVPQHEILAEVAAPGSAPAFVFLHHPTQPFTSFPPIVFGLRDADSGRLHAVCESGNVWGVFAGHTHRSKLSGRFGRVPVTEVAIPRDYPFGYALVDVTDHGYSYRFHQISNQELLQEAYPLSGEIHRRYARGDDADRAFVWTA
ncbi:MAG: metallophosphoesterase family protein [Actinomycetota bacterium]